jgi:hypothetical protein
MSGTVIEHVLARLKALGIAEIFGVAGDYAFPVDDAIGFALDEGESIEGLGKQGPAPAGAAAVRPPDANGFLWIDRDGFAKAFAADVDPVEASVMAAVQKPLSVNSFTGKSGPPAWKHLPSLVHSRDRRPNDSATGGGTHG